MWVFLFILSIFIFVRHIIREQLLLEKKIAELRANLTISFDLRHDVSGH